MPSELAELLREAEERRRSAHMSPPAVRQEPWYRIQTKASAPKQAELWIFDVIGSTWFNEGTDAKSFTKELAGLDVEEILLHVNSPGGDAFDGLAIYNALVDHKARVTAVVEGLAASAASYILQAGDVRRINRAGQMMIHDAAGFAMGNPREMQQALDMLEKISASIAGIYAFRGGGMLEDWRTAMRAETWYTAAEAVDAGLADEAVDEAAEPPVRASFDLKVFNYAGRQAAPPPVIPTATDRIQTPEPAGPGTTTEGGAVADNAKLREALGLKADASDDEVRAAWATSGFAQPVPPADPPQPPVPPNPPVPPAPGPDTDPAQQTLDQKLAAAAAKGGVLTLDSSQAAQLQETQRRFAALEAKLDQRERDEAIGDAIKTGKIAPARRKHYEQYWDGDREGAKLLLASLHPGLVPVDSIGYSGDGSEEAMWRSEFGQLFPPDTAAKGH